MQANLRSDAQFTLIGTPQKRIDGLDIVTGRKQFSVDLDVPSALPTMVCRPPTINGDAKQINNLAQVEAMPGITDVVLIPHTQFVAGGVAVRGQTFGQCIDAIRALDVTWEPGAVGTPSESDVLVELDRNELPLTPRLPTATAIEEKCTFHFPSRRSTGAQHRGRQCHRSERRGVVVPEVADLVQGAAGHDPRAAAGRHHRPRRPGRRPVRPASVRGRGV